ncbi:MAG TPA: peptidoglycan DD-metalloendopeptidase family protein, partial [Firmicutes bacterium]|nr:peptidoglycan DD-metalloendopeptidase family protein [Bacillota bacterium]
MRRSVGICFLVLLLLFAPVFGGAAGDRVLCVGMRGADVAALQGLLVELGHELAVDGIYGEQTEGVVKRVQRLAGIKEDGIAGPDTRRVLGDPKSSIIPYTVQSGDNLSQLARRYNTTVSVLASYNRLSNPDRLLAGQVILIPPASLAVLGRPRPKLIWPVRGPITSGYGQRVHPITKARHFHGGIDIAVPQGTPVKAAANGRVIKAQAMGNYGLGIVLDHNGYTTWYGHNSKLLVRPGEKVRQGQTIAQSGRSGLATGPHLDFRIKIGDQTIDPLK